jgi:nucleoside-diphosphate-sugar epimerase
VPSRSNLRSWRYGTRFPQEVEKRWPSLYAKAKVASERALTEFAGDHFGAVISRLGGVFGLSLRPRFDPVANLFTTQAVSRSESTVFGAHQWRPFVNVKDVARAIVRCLQARPPASMERPST